MLSSSIRNTECWEGFCTMNRSLNRPQPQKPGETCSLHLKCQQLISRASKKGEKNPGKLHYCNFCGYKSDFIKASKWTRNWQPGEWKTVLQRRLQPLVSSLASLWTNWHAIWTGSKCHANETWQCWEVKLQLLTKSNRLIFWDQIDLSLENNSPETFK